MDLFELILTIFVGPGLNLFLSLLGLISGIYITLCNKSIIKNCDRKKFLKKIITAIIIWFALAIIFVGYAFFDALVLGETKGLIHHDKASCMQEDYLNAKDYFSSQDGVSEIKWDKNSNSIIVVISEIKKAASASTFLKQYEGCDLVFKTTNGRTINVGRGGGGIFK